MKQSLSKLNSDSSPLFLDASVIINLVASERSDEILKALGRPIYLEKTICSEFIRDPRDGSDAKMVIEKLVNQGLLKIITLSSSKYEIFLSVTGALPPDDLGDGEAATIACASGVGVAVIDERKATRIATKVFPNMPVYSSLDLLCADCMIKGLGKAIVINAVRDAIRNARMRVPHPWKRWVSDFVSEH